MLKLFRIGRIAGCLLLLCTILLTGINTRAQAQNTPPQPVYVGYNYMKTVPGQFDAYDSLLRMYSKKIMEREIKDGNFFHWAAYEVLMPAGEKADYNVVVITVTNKIDQLLDPPGTAKEVFAKNFPDMNEAQRGEVMKGYGAARSLIKREIYTILASTGENGPPTKTPSKYLQVDYMTPVAGKEQDYVKMERDTFKPIHLQRIKLGALQGWVLLEKVLPGDTNDPAPYVTVNFYDNFSGMMDGKYDEAIKKAYPTSNADKMFQSVGTVKKGQRIEVWKLMVTDSMQATAGK